MIAAYTLALSMVPYPNAIDIQNLKLKDMPWGTKVTEVKPPLGFRFRHSDRPNSYAWQGRVGPDDAVVVYAFTPLTTRLSEVTIILGTESPFIAARARYMRYCDILTRNYGRHTQTYESFVGAYTSQRNTEDAALLDGKYILSHFWAKFSNTFIGMAITPEGWTCITFESNQLRDTVRQESEMVLQ